MSRWGWLQEQLASGNPDLIREMVASFVQTLMGAEADAICGAGHGEVSEQRVHSRNGYRPRGDRQLPCRQLTSVVRMRTRTQP